MFSFRKKNGESQKRFFGLIGQKRSEELQKAQAGMNVEVGAEARSLLNDPRYKKYKELYQRAANNSFILCLEIDNEESDPVKYMTRMKSVLSAARVLGEMGFHIERFSNIKAEVTEKVKE